MDKDDDQNNQPQKSKLQEELEAMRAERDKHDAEILKGVIDYHSKGLPQTTAELAEYAVVDSVPGIWRGSPQNEAGFSTDTRPVVVQISGQYIPGLEIPDGKIDLLTDSITNDPEKAREVAESYHYHANYSGPELTPPEYVPSVDKHPMEFIPLEVLHEMATENAPLEADHARDAEAAWMNDGADMEPFPAQPLFLGDDESQPVREFDQIEPAHEAGEFVRDYGPTDLQDFNREGPENDGGDGGYDID